MSLGVAVPGVTSQGRASSDLTGGSNTEDQEAFRARVMDAYREPPRGGAEMDYATWAISVPGVTRAWCLRNGYGAGTVVVYIMLDAAQAGHDGFPVGQDGVATDEPRSAGSWGPVDRGECALSIAAGDGVGICVFTASQFTDPDAGGIKWRQLIHTRSNCSGCCGSPNAVWLAKPGRCKSDGSCDRDTRCSADGRICAGVIVGRQGGVDTEYSGNITSDQGYLPVLENIIYRP